jgi:threonine/homoserine/homoserine lactone efflux protein
MIQTEWAIFGTVALAHALAVVSPGPDFAMVVRQSLAYGRAAGVWTAAGIGSGIVLHVLYGLFGLAWAVQRFPALLSWIGFAGALFLIWMGSVALRAQPAPDHGSGSGTAQSGGPLKDFGIGLLTNTLNPKAILFFVALFSALVAGTQSFAVKLAMGLWLPLATFGWFAFVALMLSNAALRGKLRRAAHWIDRAMGVVLLLLGGGMLVSLLG